MGFWDKFSTDIGIDLGTCNTLIYERGKGIVINEPSVIAVERGNKEVVAVGAEAKRMLYKTPGNIIAIRPLADGVIADMDGTEKMIRYFISKIKKKRQLIKSMRMKIGVPTCITEVEKRAVLEAAAKAGAKQADVIAESLAAAIGAGIPIHEPAGHMVCDIGGGTTEVSVISLGGMVVTSAIRIGGDEFDEAIIKHVRNIHSIEIGQETAERIKIEIGNVAPDKENGKIGIRGRDAVTGLPHEIVIDSVEVTEALKDPITQIIDEIKRTLGKTPPELAADIFERGIVMTGGGSLLKGLPTLVRQETGVPVILVEQPLECVAVGAGLAFDLFKDMSSDRSIYDNL
ncbi:MAG: rod shape-determining protein [Spirochaetaceae bacterium]|jgi:rod shape-determining protein MreB|nr:rod shape-determining protein [Spirochaetaceae bacterium]